mmetsp:Transcript_128683/g.181495  ORF Transcript_128683/g.181495 Transcript_128683/m.181495 type:complete len:90 (+) Transcript_128683:181-450(+)|eukprot:s180_g28.t1
MVDRTSSSEPSAHAAHVAAEGDDLDMNNFQPNCPAARGQAAGTHVEESQQLHGALDKFFNDFHRHIFDPVLLRLEALAIREDPSQVHKD